MRVLSPHANARYIAGQLFRHIFTEKTMPAPSRRNKPALLLAVVAGFLLIESGSGMSQEPVQPTPGLTPVVNPVHQLGSPPRPGNQSEPDTEISSLTLAASSSLSTRAVDWLGPAAPLALSPFFGMTCLSGLAIWGPEWMPAKGWLDGAGPLNNQWVFWIFLTLTILTSLPRFMKVTKPVAQLAEQAETYCVLVMLFIVRFVASTTGPEVASAIGQPEIMAAGIGQMTTDMLLYIVLLINVIVINGVKVCFELLVWMTPFPFIDAIFESANKAVCAGLMTLYAFSPLLATIMNLVLFLAAAIVFRWVTRISGFYRAILLDYARATFFGRKWKPGTQPVLGFTSNAWKGMPARARVALYRMEKGWAVCPVGWFFNGREIAFPDTDFRLHMVPGMLTTDLVLAGSDGQSLTLVITRYYAEGIPELAKLLCGRVVELAAVQPSRV